jgi:SAM-dependent methyltransferase
VERRDLREQNRLSWNAVVGAHESHRGDLAGYLRGGGSTLFPEERALLGDLSGKTLAHLHCNSGGDSLSLALLGAAVTGVDISDEAISAARDLSSRTGISADFVRADVYDWLEKAVREGRTFDVVYASYGVVCWLPDLDVWARGIAATLEPAGRFVLVEFHPVAEMFDEGWNRAHPYPSGGEPRLLKEGVGDYVGESGGGLTPAGFAEGVRDFRNPRGSRNGFGQKRVEDRCPRGVPVLERGTTFRQDARVAGTADGSTRGRASCAADVRHLRRKGLADSCRRTRWGEVRLSCPTAGSKA